MSQFFKETAHTKTDLSKYAENYERIFGEKKEEKMSDDNNKNGLLFKEIRELISSNGYDDVFEDVMDDDAKNISELFQEHVKQLEERLKYAEKTIEYYGNKDNWLFEIDGREEGERAREYLERHKTTD